MNNITQESIHKESGEAFTAAVIVDQILDRMIGDDVVVATAELREITAEDGDGDALQVTMVRVSTELWETYAIGHVIFFWLAGGNPGQTYRVFFTVTTADAQTITVIVPVEMLDARRP